MIKKIAFSIYFVVMMTILFLMVTAILYFLVVRPYVSCFSRPIPVWSNVGHFERCVIGVRPGWFDNNNRWHDE